MNRSRFSIGILFASLTLASAAHAAVTLYTETFGNSTGSAKNMSTVGWNAHFGATAQDRTNDSSVSASSPAAVWTTAAIGGTIGYGFGALSSSSALYWTTEPGAVAVNMLDSLSFYSNNTTTNGFRFALRLDNGTSGNTADDFWVVSNQIFDSSSGGSSGNWATNNVLESLSFNTAGAAWRDLSFTPGSALNLGAVRSTDLPDGNATAFGLFAIDGTVRFDNFTVAVTPEPSRFLLLLMALGGMAMRRRR